VYIEKAKIKKRLPGTLEIIITPANEICTIETNGSYFVVSDGGKILERVTTLQNGLYNVTGVDMSNYKVGDVLHGDDGESIATLGKVTQSIIFTDFPKVTAINLTDIYNIELTYDNRITVKCGTYLELDYKLRYAKDAIKNEESNNSTVKGTLDVSYAHTTDRAVFSPSWD
jgi:cell division septal protein FtsQ